MIAILTKDLAPNDPMPCGFVRKGVKLKARLAHYRQCAHPACQERDFAARVMMAEIRDDLAKQRKAAHGR